MLTHNGIDLSTSREIAQRRLKPEVAGKQMKVPREPKAQKIPTVSPITCGLITANTIGLQIAKKGH